MPGDLDARLSVFPEVSSGINAFLGSCGGESALELDRWEERGGGVGGGASVSLSLLDESLSETGPFSLPRLGAATIPLRMAACTARNGEESAGKGAACGSGGGGIPGPCPLGGRCLERDEGFAAD